MSLNVILSGLLLGCQPDAAPSESRPNIIFLMADDQRADAFGFMGNTHVLTPHLDQLAAEGVVFDHAYHVSPICMPSRSSIMTGQYLGTHGSGFDRPTDYVLTEGEFESSYPVLLRNHGYFTGFIGKFGFAVADSSKVRNHNYQDDDEYMPTHHFDVWNGFPGQGSYHPRNGQFNGYKNRWEATHLTEFLGYQALDFLRQAKYSAKPFCLSISFKAPHAPFQPAPAIRQAYDTMNIPRMHTDKPAYHASLPEVVREKSRNARWYFGRTKDYYGNEIAYRQDWHIERDSNYQTFIKNYYALITGVDEVVGNIRAELADLGLEENTIFVYTSDNGFFAGSRQLMGKALLYEASVRAPMIVFDPTVTGKEGVRREKGLISHVDIAPTLLDIAGVTAPEHYPGASFLPIVRGKKVQVHEAVYSENNYDDRYPLASEVAEPGAYQSIRSRSVRTIDYKYIRYHECRPVIEELYKIDEDPAEMYNLIQDPAYSDVADKMRECLDNFERKHVKFSN